LGNAHRLIRHFNFKAAIFVKYEFWFNHIQMLKAKNVPLFYISTTLRKNQYFFKPWGRWFRNHFYDVEHFFTQNEETADLLRKMGINKLTVAGDTRFDRVYDIAMQAQRFPDIEEYIGGRKCIIAGSSWPSDEKLLYNFIENMPEDYCFIMVPHDISDSHIKQIESHLHNYQLYTNFVPSNRTRTLVINKIGILSKIYRYAKFAYIGAGFYDGIHNIQEAIVYDVPVIFGPKYHAFEEAVDLVELKGAFVINNQQELEEMFYKFINDEDFYKKASKICHDYVSGKIGATEKTMLKLKEFLS
ncbi:MAG: 3-deoxy-D-manno-octulosonic acid transferase, partial [Bacteroidetes bacterium]|nr:3-deoxy-D-manno-octulosonic acid transferase [Bacteroidota bacterium]